LFSAHRNYRLCFFSRPCSVFAFGFRLFSVVVGHQITGFKKNVPQVAQVAAHILGVPLDTISVKPSNNLSNPNAIVTGGSVGSEAVSYVSLSSV